CTSRKGSAGLSWSRPGSSALYVGRVEPLRVLVAEERRAQLLGLGRAVLDGDAVAQLAVELVVPIPREDMLVVVPDMLVPGRLVVLAGAGAIGLPRQLH